MAIEDTANTALTVIVRQALAALTDPHTDKDLLAAGSLKSVRREGDLLRVSVQMGYPLAGWRDALIAELRRTVAAASALPAERVVIDLTSKISAHEVQKGLSPLPGVKNVMDLA